MTIYDGIMDGIALARQGAAQHKQRGLASLVGKAYSAPQEQRQGLLGQIASIDPGTAVQTQNSLGAWDDSRQEALVRSAQMLLAAPEEARPQVWSQIVAAGQIPGLRPDYDPVKVPEMAQKIVASFARSAMPAEMQTWGALTSGLSQQDREKALRIKLGLDPRAGLLDIGEYAGGVFGVNRDPNNVHAIPVPIGGGQPQVRFMADDGQGIPPDEMAAFQAAVAADARGEDFNIPVGGRLPPRLDYQGGGQLQAAPDKINQIEVERLRLAQEAAARDAAKFQQEQALGGMTPQQAFKLQQARKKESTILSSGEAKLDDTIKLVDDILAKKGDFGGVTGMGALGARIPGSDWADLANKLETLKARSAFGSLSEMRAASPTGGALGSVTERELSLLQNAETQLGNSQSPKALEAALLDYKRKLQEAKKRMRAGFDEFYQDLPSGNAIPVNDTSDDDLIGKYL